jgi:hypothetical protein
MWRQLCEFDSMFYKLATIVLCSSFTRWSIYFTESGGDCDYALIPTSCCNECTNNINGNHFSNSQRSNSVGISQRGK